METVHARFIYWEKRSLQAFADMADAADKTILAQ